MIRMETRKESLSTLKLCRFCLSQDETLTSLYDRSRMQKNAISLSLKILSCVSIEIFPSDKMPSYICGKCRYFMHLSYEFKQICRLADENIMQFIQTGAQLKNIEWPPTLSKLVPTNKRVKTKNPTVMKTVVEGGATVQVSTQDTDSEIEDDENVYNVKLEDSIDDGSKAPCIKVITSNKQERAARSRKDSEDLERDDGKSIEDGCWPCDDCDRSYPLQQMLELHKIQKHRTRPMECDQCDAKFFTKYDLATHKLRHSEEMPFQCVACDKRFRRLILLKRHEKLIHADLPQQVCPSCPATFLTIEQLEEHQSKHINQQTRYHVCDVCSKKFQDKSTLQRHKETMHAPKRLFSCEYCPMRFPSVTKLSRHVRTHAGERAYPCKYCSKSFMKSHHYTRHLRVKHRETQSKPVKESPEVESDQFRCEQCDDTFSTQDELIYHSAIHATQNLICPLCQEKFDDVDAVTTHIKSHVNGTEFMCDFCELVFTTKEKLDNHITNAHDDEMQNEMDTEQEEEFLDMDAEDEDDDGTINVKEEDDHMVVEIKKPDEFLLKKPKKEYTDKNEDTNTNSEESEPEDEIESPPSEPLSIKAPTPVASAPVIIRSKPAEPTVKQSSVAAKTAEKHGNQSAVLRKAEEIKRKAAQRELAEKKTVKVSSVAPVGASDKSLRLLEKELQDLKRTNNREVSKAPAKTVEVQSTPRRGRPPTLHTSTPKPKTVEEKKASANAAKPVAVEKKQQERRPKENKEPKETKGNNNNSIKEEPETKEKEPKDTSKNAVVNNESNEKNSEDSLVRRSSRPSKFKNYAKMIQDSSQSSNDEEDEESDENNDDDGYNESRPKPRKSSIGKPTAPPKVVTATPAAPAKKRGRPRKEPSQTPNKIKKTEAVEEEKNKEEKATEENNRATETKPTNESETKLNTTSNKITTEATTQPAEPEQAAPNNNLLVSPTGQTLKKVPIKALPPGVRPLPLPATARLGSSDMMQLGNKMMKVQKIVMTKAEVEALAKQGLVEIQDGAIVLKRPKKVLESKVAEPPAAPSADSAAIPESPVKNAAAPAQCPIGNVENQ